MKTAVKPVVVLDFRAGRSYSSFRMPGELSEERSSVYFHLISWIYCELKISDTSRQQRNQSVLSGEGC